MEPKSLTDWRYRLEAVKNAKFSIKKLLNRTEQNAFHAARRFSGESSGASFYVMAQVSLGEILRSKNRQAYLAINWMRCDIVVVGLDFYPIAVIEVQGSGHRGNTLEAKTCADVRDEIKEEACRRAAIPMIEIDGSHWWQIARQVETEVFKYRSQIILCSGTILPIGLRLKRSSEA